MAETDLPGDIDPDSCCRLPLPERDELPEAAQRIYDDHLDPGGGSLAGLKGPGGIRLHSPLLSELTQATGRYLRHEADYSPAIRELAILVTVREMDSRFQWAAHEHEALKRGLSAETIDIVKHRKGTEGLPEAETAVIELGREIFGHHRVTPETFARALAQFGRTTLVDLVSLMGNYSASAALLLTFDMQLRDGETALLPV